MTSVDYFPGTRCYLANGYDIITLSRRARNMFTTPPLNQTISRMFAINWPGALLVVKRARRHRGRAIHITAPEIPLIGTLVERLVLDLYF